MNSVHALVTGRVQGVGYRAFAADAARRGSLSGWVRNLPDGSVEVCVQGPVDRLTTFVEVLRAGPPAARVADVVLTWSAANPTPTDGSFVIRT
jgi:acylphosphatase